MKRGIREENSWEARKVSRVEKRSVVEVWNPTRGEPASEAIANYEVISSLCFWLPSWSEMRQIIVSCKKIYKGHDA